jgi:F-type H+-transporting ATPase subunit beta
MTAVSYDHESEHTPAPGQPVQGRVIGVRGTVVEVEFGNALSPLEAALHCQLNGNQQATAVVHAHLDRATVQAIAIDSTRGLRCGSRVHCPGSPLLVPVGKALLGRVIDLYGRPIDGGAAFHDVTWTAIHRPPQRYRTLAGCHSVCGHWRALP